MAYRCSLILAVVCALALCGCGPKETPVHQKTVSEIDADINKVQGEVSMPPQANGMALGSLQKQREIAAKNEAGGK
jgi:hypothetical protein